MDEQLKQELARILQVESQLQAQHNQMVQQLQQLANEIIMIRGEGRLVQKLLQQNKEAEAEEVSSEEE